MAHMSTQHRAPKVFLSYAREDQASVETIYDRLAAAGIRAWMDARDILPGEDWEKSIWRAVRDSDFVVICLSRRSTGKRGFLQREVKRALELWEEKLEEDIYLIPARLEECIPPSSLRKFQWVDLFRDKGFDLLLEAITTRAGRIGLGPADSSQGTWDTGYRLRTIEETEDMAYQISLSYPEFHGFPNDAHSEINPVLYGYITNLRQGFRRQSLSAMELEVVREERKRKREEPSGHDDLTAQCKVALVSNSLLSLEFRVWTYYSGAAHPNSYTRTYNFQFSPVIQLSLEEIFHTFSSYIHTLSERCRRALLKQADEAGYLETDEQRQHQTEWIEGAVAVTPENFPTLYQKFLLLPHSLRIIFDPYEVGPYSWGRRVVDLPWETLRDALRSDFARRLQS